MEKNSTSSSKAESDNNPLKNLPPSTAKKKYPGDGSATAPLLDASQDSMPKVTRKGCVAHEPSPQDVAVAAEMITQESERMDNSSIEREHPWKRQKQDVEPMKSVAAAPAHSALLEPGDETPTAVRTPILETDASASAAPSARVVAEPVLPPMVRRANHSGSVSSDLSSASANSMDDRHEAYDEEDAEDEHTSAEEYERLSPESSEYVEEEVPPAPPSTPASHVSDGILFEGMSDDLAPPLLESMTPSLPFVKGSIVGNVGFLEQQQRLLAEAETPLPTKTHRNTDKNHSDADGKPAYAPAAAGSATPKPARGSAKAPPLPEDFSDWAVGNRYELVRVLGRGSYGEVAQAIDLVKTASSRAEPCYVAIKRIQSPFDQQVDAVRLYREMHILRCMRQGGDDPQTEPAGKRHHDCIIQLLDVVPPPTDDLDDFHDLYLVFEYVDTDLYKLIMSPQYLTTEHIQTFLYQMLAGLKYIHSFSVIHRDLKPANILLNEDCSLKICDFGLARIVPREAMSTSKRKGEPVNPDPMERPKPRSAYFYKGSGPPPMGLTRQLTKHVVTRWYRAPELILIQPYTSAVDIWSVGCIFAELLSMQEGNVPGYQDRKPLFPGGTCFPLSGEVDNVKADDRLDQLSVIFSVIGTPPAEDITASGKAHEYIKSLPKTTGKKLEAIYPASDPLAIDLLKKMLRFNPKHRVTAEEALDHAFFQGVRQKELEKSADAPLEAPAFLEEECLDLRVLKQQVFDEVIWYRDHAHAGEKKPRSFPT